MTVYYDPTDPSANSALDLKAASARAYRDFIFMLAMELLIILSVMFFALLDANERKPTGAVIVDNHGTVIYPDEIKIDPRFDSASRVGEPKSDGADENGEGRRAGDFEFVLHLRELYLEAVNRIHPDRAASEADLVLRERLMKEANAAFENNDADTLRRIIEEYSAADLKQPLR